MEIVYKLLTSAMYESPFIVVLSAGIILAVINRKKMPKASMFAIFGFGMLLFNSLIGIGRLTWIILYSGESSTQTIQTISLGTGILTTVFGCCGLALLTAAIFVERTKSNLKEN